MSAILLIAIVFGGGGVRYGLANLVVQLTALIAIAANRASFVRFWRDAPISVRGLIGASLALPLIQTIPLPPSIWQALPGREIIQTSLQAVDYQGWMPVSVDPRRTLLAASALITPLAILFAGWKLPAARLLDLGWLLVGLGLTIFALGALQVVSQGTVGTLYSERPPSDLLLGTFANRNSTGVLLVGILAFAIVLPAPRQHPMALPIRLVICAILALAIILTRSRTAFALLAIPGFLGALRIYLWWVKSRAGVPGRIGQTRGALTAGIGLALVGVVAAGVLLAAPGRLGETLERFERLESGREYIWEDAPYSIARFWPVGAGLGTFDEVFQVDESLENITPRRAGRAHNDYLDVAIEAGAPGLALVAAWASLIAWLTWSARKSRHRMVAWAGSAFLFAIALQSITDYPLRNQTILAAAGFALLILVRLGRPQDAKSTQ